MNAWVPLTATPEIVGATELNSILAGGNHINPGQTKFLNDEGPYSGTVDTMDPTASVSMTIVDDAGNSQTVPLNNIRQSDRC